MEKLKGIVLKTVKFGDNGHIVDVFTETRGRMSFMVKRLSGGRRKSALVTSKIVPSLLLPLSMLEFECDIHGQERLPHPKNIQTYHTYQSLHFNPMKSTVTLFIAEFLSHALYEEGENRPLFKYLEESLQWFDYTDKEYGNFHLVFLMRLTRFLGIYPNTEQDTESPNPQNRHLHLIYYDLLNSEYHNGQPPHPHYLKPDEAALLSQLTKMNYHTMHLYRMSRKQRQRFLEVEIEYYKLHIPGFRDLKSLDVLQELFD